MSIFKYIVQGVGWEIGREAAREGIDKLKAQDAAPAADEPVKSKRQLAREARELQKAEELARKRAEAEAARQRAEIDAQLAELKKKAGR